MVHGKRVWPEEQAHVVEESGPLAHEPYPWGYPALVEHRLRPLREQDGALNQIGDVQNRQDSDGQKQSSPVADVAHHGRVAHPVTIEKILNDDHYR